MRTLILLSILFLLVPIVSAEYNNTGGHDFDFNLDSTGDFNQNRDIANDFITYTQSFSDLIMHPLISDFDGDGNLEIFIQNGDTSTIINNKDLTVADTYDLGTISQSEETSNLISFDIDGDGYTEIIFWEDTTDKLRILEWNGSDIFEQHNFTLNRFPQIACKAANECIAFYSPETSRTGAGQTMQTFVIPFDNSSTTASAITLTSTGLCAGCDGYACMPRIKNIPVVDYDGDNDFQFLVSFYEVFQDGASAPPYDANYKWMILDNTSSTISIVSQGSGAYANEAFTFGSCTGIDGDDAGMGTAVFIDATNSKGNLEVAAGGMVTGNSYEMFIDSSDGSDFITEEPSAFTAEGEIISNIVVVREYDDLSEKESACVMGYDETDQLLELLCLNDAYTLDSVQYEYNPASLPFNVHDDRYNYDIMIHAVQHDEQETSNVDLDEIITPYGIFILNQDSILNFYLETNFLNPRDITGVFLSTDFDQIGADDLLLMTNNSLIYYDDGQQREAPTISNLSSNPCIDNTVLAINTTLQISARAEDNNPSTFGDDPIHFEFLFYDGDVNVHNITAYNQTTDSDGFADVTRSMLLNKTILNGVITVKVWDDFSAAQDSVSDSFQVAENGQEFGESSCKYYAVAADPSGVTGDIVEATTTISASTNSIDSFLTEAQSLSGLSGQVIWIILMIVLAIGIFVTAGVDPHIKMGMVAIIEVLMVTLGILFGVFNIGLIITFIVIGVAVLGIWLSKFVTGTKS